MNYKKRERERNFDIHALKYPHTPNAFSKRVSCDCEGVTIFDKLKNVTKFFENTLKFTQLKKWKFIATQKSHLNLHIFFLETNKMAINFYLHLHNSVTLTFIVFFFFLLICGTNEHRRYERTAAVAAYNFLWHFSTFPFDYILSLSATHMCEAFHFPPSKNTTTARRWWEKQGNGSAQWNVSAHIVNIAASE